jgi:putative Mg2+ transporter-C (MgtC) family protein
MFLSPDDVIKLLLAVLIGGIVGFEREVHSKAAGLRTITLITIGSTLFTVLSLKFGDDRIVANIVNGVGFLGAGVIILSQGRVRGLTTASSIWAAAALGMAVGIGQYLLAGMVTILVVIVLGIFRRLDRWLEFKGREVRSYEVTFLGGKEKYDEVETLFKECGLRIRERRYRKRDNNLVGIWDAEGRIGNHERIATRLAIDEDIKELRY